MANDTKWCRNSSDEFSCCWRQIDQDKFEMIQKVLTFLIAIIAFLCAGLTTAALAGLAFVKEEDTKTNFAAFIFSIVGTLVSILAVVAAFPFGIVHDKFEKSLWDELCIVVGTSLGILLPAILTLAVAFEGKDHHMNRSAIN